MTKSKLLIAITSISVLFASQKVEQPKILLEGFEEIVQQALHDFQVPGVAIGIIVDGQIVYAKGFGLRNCEQDLPVTVDTLFPIGSCTKAFTTFALGCLIDEGLLGWDLPVIDILPEFRMQSLYVTHNITIRDLVTHRSGLPRHEFLWYNSTFSRAELMNRLRYLEPVCDLRERFHYNNLMFLVAGIAMERAAGKNWEEIIKATILTPLGMTKTNFSIAETCASLDWASPYLKTEKGIQKISFRDLSMVGPGASMISNIHELCQWMQLQLNEGVWHQQSLMSKTTFKEMHTPQVVATNYPESEAIQSYAYGLGWWLQMYRGHHNISHDGISDGFTSIVSLLPQHGIGVALLCNQNLSILPRILAMSVFDRVLQLLPNDYCSQGLEALVKNQEVKNSNKIEDVYRKKNTHPSHPLQDYIGSYVHPGYGQIDLELLDGVLQAKFNRIIYRLDHWHYDTFCVANHSEPMIVSNEGLKLTFRNNLNGDIDELLVPFEPEVSDIIFKRLSVKRHDSLSYLRKFLGTYEFYNYVVEIVLRNHNLYAVIPGQPIRELVPGDENEFTVKDLVGYTVRFLLNPLGAVQEVHLIQPYGLVFSAKLKT